MILYEADVISGRFFHKICHILQNIPKNMLTCNWIVITMAMLLSNNTEVFVSVVYYGFPTKNKIFIIFDGSTAFFSRCGTWANFVQRRTVIFRCVAIFCNRNSYQDIGNNFARLGPWPRDSYEAIHRSRSTMVVISQKAFSNSFLYENCSVLIQFWAIFVPSV